MLGKIKRNRIVFVLGMSVMFTTYVVMLWIFFTAYSTPQKEVIAAINNYGEADVEAILFLVTFVPALITFSTFARILKQGGFDGTTTDDTREDRKEENKL